MMRWPFAWRACIVLAISAAVQLNSATSDAQVTPPSRSSFGRSIENFQISVDLGAITYSRQPVDILLLFDCTSSMENVIGIAQANADVILRDIRLMYADAAFGVACLADYDTPMGAWQLYQDFTLELSRAADGIRAITLAYGGGSYPEAYSRALFEARLLNWRPAARKYVVLFGDAPARDPGFYGQDFGIDAGRDGIEGSADDLRFEAVVRGLVDDSIVVLTVYDGSRDKPLRKETRRGFDFLARATGGVSVPMSSAKQIVTIVKQNLRRILQPVPALRAPRACQSWVVAESFVRVNSTNLFRAQVSVRPPLDAARGIYRFPLNVIRSEDTTAEVVGRTVMTVRIGVLNLPWRAALLLLFLVPALAFLFGRARLASRRFVRFEQNMAFARLLARGLPAALIVVGCMAVWYLAPGTIAAVSKSDFPVHTSVVDADAEGGTNLPEISVSDDAPVRLWDRLRSRPTLRSCGE